jgi:hypothetical protein
LLAVLRANAVRTLLPARRLKDLIGLLDIELELGVF